MTDLPEADPNLKDTSEFRCGSVRDTTSPRGPAEAEEDGFTFWRDVIGDDIVCGGIVYSSDEWTHDGEGDVRRLTPAEKAARDTNRLHPNNPDHPEVAAAYAALATEHDDALRREELMAEAIDLWNRELAAEMDNQGIADTVRPDLASRPTSSPPRRPARRRFRGPRPVTGH